MRTIFYIGWFIFMVITSPFSFLKMKLDRYLCNHKDLMYKGKNGVCVHCGKIVLLGVFLLFISIKGFSQIKVTPIGKITTPVFTNPSLSDLKTIKATKEDSSFVIKMSGKILSGNKVGNNLPNPDAIYQLDSSDVFSLGDSVFVVHYFYISDSTHPYRVNGGYIGKKSDFNTIMKGNDKFKFRNK